MKTCFVIMPIGEIHGVITEADLHKRYTDLIKEAIAKADPSLEVIRADEVSAPGVINTDVLTRLMHSDIVIADITFPNANVFYEMGMRHAVRSGTILIRGNDAHPTPFDVANLRYTPYENTSTGLKALSESLSKQFAWIRANPGKPDSAFLELATVTKYKYPSFTDAAVEKSQAAQVDVMMRVMRSPKGREIMAESSKAGGQMTMDQLAALIDSEPDLARDLMTLVMQQQGGTLFSKK